MNGTTNDAEQRAFSEREKFVTAFNETMLKIWKEQMTLLDVIDTGALLASPKSLPLRADGRFIELGLSQSFLEYGLWQNFGTGKEIPRGNNGDIGRERKRKIGYVCRVHKMSFKFGGYEVIKSVMLAEVIL